MALRPLLIHHTIHPQFYDFDLAGIVSNIVHVRWLEDLRTLFLEKHFTLEEQVQQGHAPVVLETHIAYRHPIRFGDRVTGSMWVGTLESVRWEVQAEFAVGGRIAATATQRGCFATIDGGRPIRMPRILVEAWKRDVARLTTEGSA